MERDQEL